MVGATEYLDPGSVILISKILVSATEALALVLAPASTELTFEVPVDAIVKNLAALVGLPNATPALLDVLIVLDLHTMPSVELAAVVVADTARNTPCP